MAHRGNRHLGFWERGTYVLGGGAVHSIKSGREQMQQIASYSITSSATESSAGGTVRPEHSGGHGVDHQLQLCRLHDGQIYRLSALEDSTGIDTELTNSIRYIDSVTHQPADFWNVARRIGRGNLVEGRQLGQLDTPARKKGVVANEQSIRPLTHKRCEGPFDFPAAAGIKNLDLQSHCASGRFHVSQRCPSICRIGWIDQHSNSSGGGHHHAQEFQPLRRQLADHQVDAG